MNEADEFGVGDIVTKTGAKQRAVLLWADGGALRADAATDRAGRGVHRRFAWREVQIAAVLKAVSPFGLPIGVLKTIGEILRLSLDLAERSKTPSAPAFWGPGLRAVFRGERDDVFLAIEPTEDAVDKFEFHLVFGAEPARQLTAKASIVVSLAACWAGLEG